MPVVLDETSPDVIAAFMQQIIVEYHGFGNGQQRTEPRESIAIPVFVQPVDSLLQSTAAPFHAITRDISFGGIGIFHSERLETQYLKISLQSPETHQQMQLLAKVEHQTTCGAFSIVGCRFATGAAKANNESDDVKVQDS